MSKLFRNLTVFSALLILTACSGSSGNNDSGRNSDKPGDPINNNITIAKLDADEIQNNGYSLRVALNFFDAEEELVKKFEGSTIEHTVKQFRIYLLDKRRISPAEADSLDTYCALIVETSETANKSDFSFQPGNLYFVQIQHIQQGSDYEVTVSLQAAMFQQFFVSCKNTPDSTAIRRHVGHILNIQPK